jgi:hypothetical protein
MMGYNSGFHHFVDLEGGGIVEISSMRSFTSALQGLFVVSNVPTSIFFVNFAWIICNPLLVARRFSSLSAFVGASIDLGFVTRQKKLFIANDARSLLWVLRTSSARLIIVVFVVALDCGTNNGVV